MRRLWSLLRHGNGLRYAPVVYDGSAGAALRVMLRGMPEGPLDVSDDHCPVSLCPFVVGIRLEAHAVDAERAGRRLWLEIHPSTTTAGGPLARLALKPAGVLPLKRGDLHLFEVERTVDRSLPTGGSWVQRLLAWRAVRASARRGEGLRMSEADLRALNAYYILARPVFLVGVGYEARNDLFPMDLVGALSSGEYLLALRATSAGVALIESSRRIAMSSAPADQLDLVYALGSRHRPSTIDLANVAVPTSASPHFGLPTLNPAQFVRELVVERVERIGSHVLFMTRVDHEAGCARRQLAHMSGTYIEWLRCSQRAPEVLPHR